MHFSQFFNLPGDFLIRETRLSPLILTLLNLLFLLLFQLLLPFVTHFVLVFLCVTIALLLYVSGHDLGDGRICPRILHDVQQQTKTVESGVNQLAVSGLHRLTEILLALIIIRQLLPLYV